MNHHTHLRYGLVALTLLGAACAGRSAPAGSGPGSIPACTSDDDQTFASARQRLDDESAFGSEEGATLGEAYDRAIAEAMLAIQASVRAETGVDETEIIGSAANQSTVLRQSIEVRVDERKAGCVRERICQTPKGVRVWAKCSRFSPFEAEMRKAATTLAAALPHPAQLVVLPPTDDGYQFTYLGYRAQGILERRIQQALSPDQGLKLIDAIHLPEMSALREHGATHVVVGETASAGGGDASLRVYVQNLDTLERLAASLYQFQVTLQPSEQESLEIKDRIFQQKAAMELAGTVGTGGGLEIRLSSREYREGELAEFSIHLREPAYVYAFSIYENGKASMLIPNEASPGNHLDGDHWYLFPDEAWKKAGYGIRVCPVPGHKTDREYIKVIATSKPLDLTLDRFTLRDMADLAAGPKGRIAEINQKVEKLRRSGARVAEARASYDIIAVPDPNTGCPKQ